MNTIIAAGRADLWLLACAHLFDPYWTRHAAFMQQYALPDETRRMTQSPDVVVASDADALARLAADRVALAARASVEARGVFHLVLAGGSTPRRLYAQLAEDPAYVTFPWARTHVYFGDERCVPPDHPGSNFRMAYESLLSHVPVPATHVHRMEGEDPDPAAAAARYESRVRLAIPHGAGETPRLDLVLLGMGADGHTASLFAGTTALEASSQLVAATWVGAVGAWRLTMTLSLLNAARAVVFLVAGADKAEAVQRVLTTPPTAPTLPAARVRPLDGTLTWMLADVPGETYLGSDLDSCVAANLEWRISCQHARIKI